MYFVFIPTIFTTQYFYARPLYLKPKRNQMYLIGYQNLHPQYSSSRRWSWTMVNLTGWYYQYYSIIMYIFDIFFFVARFFWQSHQMEKYHIPSPFFLLLWMKVILNICFWTTRSVDGFGQSYPSDRNNIVTQPALSVRRLVGLFGGSELF